MILKKKITAMDRYILYLYRKGYTIYFCKKDGLFSKLIDEDNLCPWCQKICEKVDNVEELLNQ